MIARTYLKSVSYTHLDVYKRQEVQGGSINSNNNNISDPICGNNYQEKINHIQSLYVLFVAYRMSQ